VRSGEFAVISRQWQFAVCSGQFTVGSGSLQWEVRSWQFGVISRQWVVWSGREKMIWFK